ncbi:hypothetical protein [Micromonospora coerulea]|uniref:hypothetical protein n=1 Tax=Micromonospora coerulea TaxID=47856 RepID=UPI001903723B|nr:hypothetical protein [Micromonospora veneta]
MGRFLSGRVVNLAHTFLDDETALTPAAVTVTITRAGATSSTATGTATKTGSVYTYSPGMLTPGVYTVRWDGGATAVDVETVEVVGGYVFTIPELRASDEDLTVARYPAAEVRLTREVVEAEFQRITGRSFTPRTAFLSLSELPECGDPLPFLDVASVTTTGGTAASLAFERVGPLAFMPELPDGATGIEVVYGFQSVPTGISRAAKLYARWLLLEERSSIPDRATSFQPADGGTYTLATPGRAGSETGIPTVDAVLDGFRFKLIEGVSLG